MVVDYVFDYAISAPSAAAHVARNYAPWLSQVAMAYALLPNNPGVVYNEQPEFVYNEDVLRTLDRLCDRPRIYSGKTAWRFFNAATEGLKGNLPALPRRTQALHGLLDAECGLAV